ncbi:MAG: MFS transporter [Hydrogenophilales bacterium]
MDKKKIIPWALYDFANSSYTTIVITTIFSIYFVRNIASNFENPTFIWTLIISSSYLFVCLISPFIGRLSDTVIQKKKLLFLVTFFCSSCTALLFFSKESFFVALFFLFFSNIFYSIGENINSSFLSQISTTSKVGKVSGVGWGIGYFGGICSLIIALLIIRVTESNSSISHLSIPIVMIFTGIFYFVFSLPIFIFFKEAFDFDSSSKKLSVTEIIMNLKKYSDIFMFIFLLQSAVNSFVVLSSIYSSFVMGFNLNEIILLIILVNFFSAFGAFYFGRLMDSFGAFNTFRLLIVFWMIVTTLILLNNSKIIFWILGCLVGLLIGGVFSNIRALIVKISHEKISGEFYGYWGLLTKLASIFGPLLYGVANYLSDGNHKISLLVIAFFFPLGLIFLIKSKTKIA